MVFFLHIKVERHVVGIIMFIVCRFVQIYGLRHRCILEQKPIATGSHVNIFQRHVVRFQFCMQQNNSRKR